MTLFSKKSVPAWMGFFVLVLDIATKYYTHVNLPVIRRYFSWYPYGGIGVFKNFYGIEFSISHQINHGAAWGIFGEYQTPLLYLRIALIVLLLLYALFINKQTSWNIPLALIVAGAVGNVIDYFLYGHVVDMFHFVFWGHEFPVFNVADSAITLGIVSLVIMTLFQKKSPKKSACR